MDLHVVVRGRVQGVGFRWFVRGAARSAGLSGWVKNLDDGSVEVAATGDDSAIHALREALASGPPGASVTSVDDVGAPVEHPPHPFSVQR
ncbi:MAG: acylphosphatase [Gemmatimonadaceae bacterium]